MSQYYNAKRSKNRYIPGLATSFKISRSKIDLFLECARCFYLDRRLGVGRPPGYPFNLNTAVDTLLKKEFDTHRVAGNRHPLMETYGLDLIPLQHQLIDQWRENFVGVQFDHQPTKLLVTGAVDDLWVDKSGLVYVVDYKSTSKSGEVNLDADWQIGYKRQMEIYQWLLRQNGLTVSDTGYFVYCNGDTDKEAFDAKLEFDVKIIPYVGQADWVESTLMDIKKCLDDDIIPPAGKDCDYCAYRSASQELEISSS
ncbi:MAG: PD-(D/E)XK nuclease family protein [Candidatus Komeilibacteria bacterium]|nr:PD-(D/E)XK nuclease family protein [Candidatus Komeilibacteria bacterium]